MIADPAIRQLAYFVPDIRHAAAAHHAAFGSGPFFVADHIPLRHCRYRGQPATLDHSAAYGQCGALMVEFIQQNNPGPSAFRDLFPGGRRAQGLHHIALFTPDLAATLTAAEAQGFPTALYAEMQDGFPFAIADTTAAYGHMVEYYPPLPVLLDFYAMVRGAAGDFGNGALRSIALG